MKKLISFCFAGVLLLFSLDVYSQAQTEWDEVKGRKIIKELDEILENCAKLSKHVVFTDTFLIKDLDTIQQQATLFRMEIRRRSNYALQYKDDYKYYNDLLTYLGKTENTDTLKGVVSDIKEDLLLKTKGIINGPDSSLGPGGSISNASPVLLTVRVFSDTIPGPLDGFEVFLKNGTYIPSPDSTRIPQLTNNAQIIVFPGKMTIVAWKGKQYASATLNLDATIKKDLVLDMKLK